MYSFKKYKPILVSILSVFCFGCNSVQVSAPQPQRMNPAGHGGVLFGVQRAVSPSNPENLTHPRNELVVVFNVHSPNDLQVLIELLDQLRTENKNSQIIWVLEDALLFIDLIAKVVNNELNMHSEEMNTLLKERLEEDPRKRLNAMNQLRIPIDARRTNYIPRLKQTPRIEYLLQHPAIGITLESLDVDLAIEHVRSILLAVAYKWQAYSALVNEGDEDLFFASMVKSTQHYINSTIRYRDQVLAQKLHRLHKQYPGALIFIDRGIDHMDSLLAHLQSQGFEETDITLYYPKAYKKEAFSLLHFDQAISALSHQGLSDIEKIKLMNNFKRFILAEILSGTIAYHSPRTSVLAVNNIAFDVLRQMSDGDVNRMLSVIQSKNKTMTGRQKQRASDTKVFKWFIENGFISSREDIREKLARQPSGYIKKTKINDKEE